MNEKEVGKFVFKIHPIDFEVMRNTLSAITSEMGITMERTSRSPLYHSGRDFITTIFDRDGGLVALASYVPVLTLSTAFAVKATLKYFGDEIYPGDLFLVNDPYAFDAGNHLSDWAMLLPVFYKDEFIFWSVNKAHQIDTGGGAPGGYNPDARDIFAEGIKIPPVKFYEKGKLRRDVFDLILGNVRYPEIQRGDLWSMIGSVRIGERRLTGLVERYGIKTTKDFIADLYGYSEALMREEIAKIPDGTYYGEASQDGLSPGSILTIRCKTTVKGSDLTIDLSESDEQVQGYYNSPIGNTYSSVITALTTSIAKTIVHRCEGCFKPVRIITKPGTVCHCLPPVPTGSCTNFPAKPIINAVWDSLAKVIPEQVPAGAGVLPTFSITGTDPRRGEPYANLDMLSGAVGSGAIFGTDGWHGVGMEPGGGGLRRPQIEVVELAYPLLWRKWQLLTDTGGAGKWRGGTGVEETFINEGGPGLLAEVGNGFITSPGPAIKGGRCGPLNKRYIIRQDGSEVDASRRGLFEMEPADTIVYRSSGGCGVGDPLERDVEKVREDVINEFVSIESARDDYGVIIAPKTFTVDYEATKKLREGKR